MCRGSSRWSRELEAKRDTTAREALRDEPAQVLWASGRIEESVADEVHQRVELSVRKCDRRPEPGVEFGQQRRDRRPGSAQVSGEEIRRVRARPACGVEMVPDRVREPNEGAVVHERWL